MSTWILLLLNFNALFFLAAALRFEGAFRGLGSVVFRHALVFTVLQAFLSAVVCVFVGSLAAPGFARAGRWKKILRWILLLPNMMSPILAVLCLLLTFPSFPYGLRGIIIGHAFLNAGLCTVWLGDRWSELESKWGPVNDVLGGSTWFFFRKGLLRQMLPQLKNTFAVVFALCLSSFAIPLVLGSGPQHSTLEVLIYERIHTDADVASAVTIGLVQCLLQFLVYVFILRPILFKKEYSRMPAAVKRAGPWSLATMGVVVLTLVPLVKLLFMALAPSSLNSLSELDGFLASSTLSLSVGVAVACMTFMALALLTGWGWKGSVVNIPALSGVAVGLAGLLLFKSWTYTSVTPVFVALIWGHMTILLLPVFRLCAPFLGNLRLKFENVLNQLGASRSFGFKRVYLKLGLKTYLAGASLAGCWSFGEFSVASMVSPSHPTLPVFIQSLLGSYRLEAASAASLILLLLSVVSMTLLEVIAHGMG